MARMQSRVAVTKQETIREMLLAAGVGEFNATLSIPYMFFLPRTCDPYAQGVMQIVQGLQNLCNQRGAQLAIDGWMGQDTQRAVARYAGKNWRDKTWVQLYGDVLNGRARAAGARAPAPREVAESGLGGIVSDITTSPLAWIAAGAAVFHFFGGSLRRANR